MSLEREEEAQTGCKKIQTTQFTLLALPFSPPHLLLGNQATRTCKKQDVGVRDTNPMLLWLPGYACWIWAIVDVGDSNHKYKVIAPKVILA